MKYKVTPIIRDIFFAIFFVTASKEVFGQRITPSPYPINITFNYIRTWDATSPQSNPDILIAKSLRDVKQTTQYFDGIGRPIQNILKQGSLQTGSAPADLVSPIVYDSIGREHYRYLPFVANVTGGNFSVNDGEFKLNPFQQDSAFDKIQFQDETWYYGQTTFDASPLNRVLEIFSPGNNWVGSSGQSSENNRHAVKTKYWMNTAADSVRIWTVTDVTNNFGTYATTSMYPVGSLYKSAIKDENNNETVEFKDKEGKTVLKKVQLIAVADTGLGKGHNGWLCTYYIYDAFNRLRAVVQPKGVELLLAGSWSMTSTILNEQCFRYEYDYRQRMVRKKVPGAGIFYMVYDARDRLTMMQDSLLRDAHKWAYTIYDALNRPAITGLITDNTNYNNVSYHWAHADTSIAWPNPANYTDEQLTKAFYDDYTWRSSEGNPLKATRSNTYDSYLQTASNTVWPYPQNTALQTNQLTGMITGSKTKVLGSVNTYLYSVSFYDEKARVIQIQSTNITGDSTIVTSQFGFAGQVLFNITREGKSNSNAQTTVILSQMTYDSLQRLIKIEKRISSTKVNSGAMPASWTTVSQNEYDALGQLRKKKFGIAPVDSLIYDYNIRGWLLGANRSYVKDTTSTVNWFGFDLGYDKTSFTVNGSSKSYAIPQFNGNIAGMLWRSSGDDYLRKYDFTYDAVNRLTSADFNQLNSNSFSKTAQTDFSVRGMTYDANGNILTMNQSGWRLGGSVTIDSLLYTYILNTNRLLSVIDRRNDTATKMGDFRSSKAYMTSLNNNKTTAATDYMYDANGNLTVDKNKDISSILYNYLNLPDSIRITGKGSIKYTYDATGNKLKKVTRDSTVSPIKITTTLYLFGNYVNDTLQFISHEEGRIRYDSAKTSLVYDYFLKDHLGNIRMVLTEEKDTSFYPPASLEAAQLPIERLFYSKVDSGRINKNTVTGYPNDPYTTPNDFIQKLSGNGVKVGAGILLKVMAGDKFNLRVSSWWSSSNTPGTPVNPFNDIISALAGSVGGLPGTAHPTTTELNNSGVLTPNVTNFLNSESGYVTSRPKAFINWILFDDRFNYVGNSSGFEQVGSSGILTMHTRSNLALNKNGYLYIYSNNETPNIDVFFDNLQVTHIRGPLTEETHYYPFGLTMAGITSKALNFGDPENHKKFNGIEEVRDLDLSQYDAFYRNLDPQIGRWWQIDPKPNMGESPYAMMGGNPILYSDILGDTAVVRWRTGFLGLGGRHEARFVGGSWIDSKTRNAINVSDVSKSGARTMMKDYQKLDGDKDFAPAKTIDAAKTNVVLKATHKGSETFIDKYLADKSSDIVARINPNEKIPNYINEGQKNVALPSSIIMGHELSHVNDALNGKPESFFESVIMTTIMGTSSYTISPSETNAMYWENMLRIKDGLPLREQYTLDYKKNTWFLNNKALINTTGTTTQISDLDGHTFNRN